MGLSNRLGYLRLKGLNDRLFFLGLGGRDQLGYMGLNGAKQSAGLSQAEGVK